VLTITVIQRVVLTILAIERVHYFSNTTMEAIGIQNNCRVYYLITLLQLSSPPVLSWVRVTRSVVLCIMFCRSLFVLFLLAIVLFVFLRFTDSDYSFGIFKHSTNIF